MIPSSWGGLLIRKVQRKRRVGGVRRRRVMGKGFFGDLWSGIKSVASSVAPTVLPLLANVAAKRLGGRKRRVHRKRRAFGMGKLKSLLPVIHGMKRRRKTCRGGARGRIGRRRMFA